MPTYATNKKVRFDYEILETLEAGLVLSGMETKSVRSGHISLKGAFVTFHNNEAYLTNAHITKYAYAGKTPDYDPEQSRKILLKKREIVRLRGKIQEAGLTIVPLSIYNKGRYIKMEIAVCKGKKKYDKREAIKKRDTDKEISRSLKNS